MAVGLRTRVRVFLRSLLLQTTWNYEGMQNLGFAYAMTPALEVLYEEPRARQEALSRHLEVYNTHPYLAALVLGASIRLEERVRQGELPAELIRSFKVGSMGSLGAIGDSFFWASLKPFCLLVSLVLSTWVGPASVVLCYLLSYNAVHFTLRLACFHVGYQRDFAALDWLRGLRIARLTGWVRNVSLVLMGCLGAACLQVPAQTYDGLERLAVTLGLFGLLFAGNRAVMSRISTTVLVYAVALAAIVVSHLL